MNGRAAGQSSSWISFGMPVSSSLGSDAFEPVPF
jgi:hypothetical protein